MMASSESLLDAIKRMQKKKKKMNISVFKDTNSRKHSEGHYKRFNKDIEMLKKNEYGMLEI